MRSKQYKGRLDSKSASEGIKLATPNAISLLEDAELLFRHQRFERCVSLSILSIEESGKSRILRGILLTEDPKELNKEWQDYRRHTAKNLAWIVPSLILGGARKLDDLKEMVDPQSDHGQTLEDLKQLSIYTDVFSSKKWSIPSKVIDENLAKMILEFARILIRNENDGMDSIEGLDLWIKYLKPEWKGEMKNMKKALIDCYSEAEVLGIIDKGKAEEMARFVE
jgi:AbiV family abortive infection protein